MSSNGTFQAAEADHTWRTRINMSDIVGADGTDIVPQPRGKVEECSLPSYAYLDFTQIVAVKTCFVVIYSLVIFLSISGNFLVIWTVARHKHMRTVTNLYITNLALSDFMVAVFVMPLQLLEYVAPCSWQVFNLDGLCCFLSYAKPVFVFASVLTLVAISVERYYAIVYPFDAMKIHTKSRTRKILGATWIIPMVLASPFTFAKSVAFNVESDLGSISRQICTDKFAVIDTALYGPAGSTGGHFRRGFFLFLFVVMYIIPMLVILATCVRMSMHLLKPVSMPRNDSSHGQRLLRKREENKRKVARMIMVVAAAFILCWTPFYTINFISQVQKVSFLKRSNFLFTMLAVHFAGFVNSCINPFIYNMMSKRFRNGFRNIVASLCCCGTFRDNLESTWYRMYPRTASHSHSHSSDLEDTKANSATVATKFSTRKRSTRVLDLQASTNSKLTCVRFNEDTNCVCHRIIINSPEPETKRKLKCGNDNGLCLKTYIITSNSDGGVPSRPANNNHPQSLVCQSEPYSV